MANASTNVPALPVRITIIDFSSAPFRRKAILSQSLLLLHLLLRAIIWETSASAESLDPANINVAILPVAEGEWISSCAAGFVVPMPTLPELLIRMYSTPPALLLCLLKTKDEVLPSASRSAPVVQT